MEPKKKDANNQDNSQQAKKIYKTPKLIDHGTVEQQTQTGGGTPSGDGLGSS